MIESNHPQSSRDELPEDKLYYDIVRWTVNTYTIPGTTMSYTEGNPAAFSYIEPLITAAGGLGLSQICAITGLEGSTIQNWVKRGWVAKTKDKKYHEVQVARILIINALRDCLQLDKIAQLMCYINGSTQDRSDDIISESTLYNYLCEAVYILDSAGSMSEQLLSETVTKLTSDYEGPFPDSKLRLQRALTVMINACVCGSMKRRTDELLAEII